MKAFHPEELNCSKLSYFLQILKSIPFCKSIRKKLLCTVVSIEGGVQTSYTLRELLYKELKISLGSYSYGNIKDILRFPVKTIIGRYTSLGPGIRIFQANHPYDNISTHPFFFRPEFGVVKCETIDRGQLIIGHDVWIGANAIICPGCNYIGKGAVIGAGAVVTKNIPDFGVMAGNPAALIKMRFHDSVISKLVSTSWWDLPITKLQTCTNQMAKPMTEDLIDEFIKKISSLSKI